MHGARAIACKTPDHMVLAQPYLSNNASSSSNQAQPFEDFKTRTNVLISNMFWKKRIQFDAINNRRTNLKSNNVHFKYLSLDSLAICDNILLERPLGFQFCLFRNNDCSSIDPENRKLNLKSISKSNYFFLSVSDCQLARICTFRVIGVVSSPGKPPGKIPTQSEAGSPTEIKDIDSSSSAGLELLAPERHSARNEISCPDQSLTMPAAPAVSNLYEDLRPERKINTYFLREVRRHKSRLGHDSETFWLNFSSVEHMFEEPATSGPKFAWPSHSNAEHYSPFLGFLQRMFSIRNNQICGPCPQTHINLATILIDVTINLIHHFDFIQPKAIVNFAFPQIQLNSRI